MRLSPVLFPARAGLLPIFAASLRKNQSAKEKPKLVQKNNFGPKDYESQLIDVSAHGVCIAADLDSDAV